MATQHTVIRTVRVISVTAKEIEAILRVQFQLDENTSVAWDVSREGAVLGAVLDEATARWSKEELLQA